MALKKYYFDHDADIGVIGCGKTLEAAFISIAESTFSLMTNLEKINPRTSIEINFQESDLELALLNWLNLLIGESIANNLIFCKFELQHKNNHWQGTAFGDNWQENMERGIEVKGATLTMLSVKKINQHWEARCVVDV